ncbi:hypothetical protein AVEN_268131-1 [Araneus ventricosus]|uniref:Uncharacterized protein n=1 Tax=Araneus ventricosus TaxID=182803 RepID=A0A4Y2K7A8_ARAVE|nr:hypothetical protein AVEN_268131-1 [Araneus ventricosus]
MTQVQENFIVFIDRTPPHAPVSNAIAETVPVGWTVFIDRTPPQGPVPDAITATNVLIDTAAKKSWCTDSKISVLRSEKSQARKTNPPKTHYEYALKFTSRGERPLKPDGRVWLQEFETQFHGSFVEDIEHDKSANESQTS